MMPSQTGSTLWTAISGTATIGTTTKMISKASITKPSRNIASMTTRMAPAAPPGGSPAPRCTMSSPPRPRNTRLNMVAPIRMTKIMQVTCVVRCTTGASAAPSVPLMAASRIEPTAPTEAASVGVAMPPRIEPSTARMRSSGATSTAIRRRSQARSLSAPAGSGGIAGDVCREEHRHADQIEDVEPDQREARNERAGEQVADRHRGRREIALLKLRRLVGGGKLVAEQHQHGRRRENLRQASRWRRRCRRRAACRSRGAAWSAARSGPSSRWWRRPRPWRRRARCRRWRPRCRGRRASAPNSRAMVSSNSSAMRERSSITPMKMNSGMASSTSLVITPIDALRQRAEEREAHQAGEVAQHGEAERHAAERQRHRIAEEQRAADRDDHQDGEDFSGRHAAHRSRGSPGPCPAAPSSRRTAGSASSAGTPPAALTSRARFPGSPRSAPRKAARTRAAPA